MDSSSIWDGRAGPARENELWSWWEPWALDTWSGATDMPGGEHADQGIANDVGLGNSAWTARSSPEPLGAPGLGEDDADGDDSELVAQGLAALLEGKGSAAPHHPDPSGVLVGHDAPRSQVLEAPEGRAWPLDASESDPQANTEGLAAVGLSVRRGEAEAPGRSARAQTPAVRPRRMDDVPAGRSCFPSRESRAPLHAALRGSHRAEEQQGFTKNGNSAALHVARGSAAGDAVEQSHGAAGVAQCQVQEGRKQRGNLLEALKQAVDERGTGGAAAMRFVETGETPSTEQRERIREALQRAVDGVKKELPAWAVTVRPCGESDQLGGPSKGEASGSQGPVLKVTGCMSAEKRAKLGKALKTAVAGIERGKQGSGRLSGAPSSDESSSHRAQESLTSRLAETVQTLRGVPATPSAAGSGFKARTLQSFYSFLHFLEAACPPQEGRGPRQGCSVMHDSDSTYLDSSPSQGREGPAEGSCLLPSSSRPSLGAVVGGDLYRRLHVSKLQHLKRKGQDWVPHAGSPRQPEQRLRIGLTACKPVLRRPLLGAPPVAGEAGTVLSDALGMELAPAHSILLAAALAGRQEEVLKLRLMKAAQAVDSGNLGLFRALAQNLRKESDRQGRASERWVHLMLEALALRVTKKGPLALNAKPPRTTLQELMASRFFFGKEAPTLGWTAAFANPMMVPRLLGHRNVHVICWAEAYVTQIAGLMKALAGESGTPTPGTPRACLERMRVTTFDPHRLVSKRTDMHSMKAWGTWSEFLVQEASKLGVALEFRVLYPAANNMPAVFEEVQPREDEVVAVALPYVMMRLPGDPNVGGGARIHLMQFVRRMKPAIVMFCEEELEASGPFLQRFGSCLDVYWTHCHFMDAVLGGRNVRLLLPWEGTWMRLHTISIVSCEGPERLVRPMSNASWHAGFRSWGFQALPVSPSVLDGVSRVLLDYNKDFTSSYDGTALWLNWKDIHVLHATCWALSDCESRLHNEARNVEP